MKKEKKKRAFSDIFAKYKTYDTKDGFGNTDDWKESFEKRMRKEKKEDEPIKYFEGCDTIKKLRDNYKKLMKKYHPDVAGDTEANQIASKEIIEEYNKLLKKYHEK